ncbi:MAG TPA: hypothetical protein VLF18_02980, partial [Tahibacter sp.]|uniref:hypothetical protein n=1 Tax=Tahibacter sp. TaxID=2056211 RepID=UPI002CF4306F
AAASGNYSVDVTSTGCSSTPATAVTVTVLAPPDLSITVTDGATQVSAGGSTTYTITAINISANPAPGVTVADIFPAALTCSWTCAGAAGGTCTGSGSGNINDTVSLPSSATVTYTAVCSIASTATGTLANTATVSGPVGATDPTPANNSATDTSAVQVVADVGLTLSDNRQFVTVGSALTYVITVTNTGPSPAAATVTDALPAQLSGGTWTCVPSAGASCAGGSGNTLTDTATLPSGSQAAYQYSATVMATGANDLIVNTASVALSSGSDPVSANNSATDTNVVSIFRDGFDGTSTLFPSVIGDGRDFVTASLRVDATLLGRLSLMPATIASGRAADGRVLFTLELARLGQNVALRTVTTDGIGTHVRSPWQAVDVDQRLLSFAWQTAADRNDAFLTVNGTQAFSLSAGASLPLTQLWVNVENDVPWLVLLGN